MIIIFLLLLGIGLSIFFYQAISRESKHVDNVHSDCYNHRFRSFGVKSGTVRRLHCIFPITENE